MTSASEEEYAGLKDKDTLPPPITLEELKVRLNSEFGEVLSDADPIRIRHFVHSVFVEDLQGRLDHFINRTDAIIRNTGAITAKAVSECLETLKDETLQSSLTNTLSHYKEQIEEFVAVEGAVKRLRSTLIILTALSWIALTLNFLLFIRS